MDRRSIVGGVAVAVVAAAAVLASPEWMLSRAEWLVADPVRFGLALLVLAVIRALLAWPVTLLAVLAGYGYGRPGILAAVVLMPLTSLPPYLLARRAGAAWAPASVRSTGRRAVNVAGDFRSVAASRLLPIPSDVVSVGAGVADVRFVPFVVGSAVGELPWAIGGALVGASLDRALSEGVGSVFSTELIVVAAVAGGALLIGPLYGHLFADENDSTLPDGGDAADEGSADDAAPAGDSHDGERRGDRPD